MSRPKRRTLRPNSPLSFKIEALPGRFLRQELQTIESKRALDPCKIEMVGAKDLQVAEFIPQTQLVVGPELAAMAGSADTLKVFAAVRIACSKSPDEPRRHDVVHMAAYSRLLEIYSTRLHLALPTQS